MKKTVFFALALTLGGSLLAQNNEHKQIEGNGKITTRDVAVSGFESLVASGVYELKLTQGGKESVRVEADENLQEYVEVRTEGKKLIIDMPKLRNGNTSFKTSKGLKVYVSFQRLIEMDLKMVGNVSSEKSLSFGDLQLRNKSVGNVKLDLTANKLNLENKSVGNMVLTGRADEATVTNNGVGSFDADEFKVQTMNIENKGMGGASVNAEKELKVKDNGWGKVENRGKATKRNMGRVRV